MADSTQSIYNMRRDPAVLGPTETNLPDPEVPESESDIPFGYEDSAPRKELPKIAAKEDYKTHEAREKAGFFEAAGAAVGGMAKDIYFAFDQSASHEYDRYFRVGPLLEEAVALRPHLTNEQIDNLLTSKNQTDFEERLEYLDTFIANQQKQADNVYGAFLGSLVDIDMVAGAPVKGLSIGSKLGKAGVGVASFGAVTAVQHAQGDNTFRTDEEQILDAITVGVSSALSVGTKKAPRNDVPPATRGVDPVREVDGVDEVVVASKEGPIPELDGVVSPKVQQEIVEQSKEVENTVEQGVQNLVRNPDAPSPKSTSGKILASLQSTADVVRYYTKGDDSTVINKLLSNPALNDGDNVVSSQNVYIRTYQHLLMPFEDSMKKAVVEITGVRNTISNRVNKKYSKATSEVSSLVQKTLQRVDADVVEYMKHNNGELPPPEIMTGFINKYSPHKSVSEVVQTYIDSGFAMRVYDDAAASKTFTKEVVDAEGNITLVNGMTDIPRRPTYLPLKHDYEKLFKLIKAGIATADELATFIGKQIVRTYPELLNPKGAKGTFKLSVKQVGQHFLQTQRANSRNLSDVSTSGLTTEDIVSILTKSGASNKDAFDIAESVYQKMHEQGTGVAKNLRRRIEWDWNATLRTESGHTLTMGDLVDENLIKNLEAYSSNMGHRNGAANYGLRSEADFDTLVQPYLDDLPDNVSVGEATKLFENVKSQIFGKPMESNPVPESIRTGQALADLFLLGASGLYNLVELATMVAKVGVVKTIGGTRQGLKASFSNLKKFNPSEAQELEDVLTGRLLANSRFKNWFTRYEDNFDVTGALHETAQYVGQSAKFLNLSEATKRYMTGVLASVYVSNLKKAMKGSAKDLDYMRNELKMSDALIREVQKEYAKHGTKIDDWSNQVRVAYEQKVFHDADNHVMNINRGEVPPLLEHSSVGRVVFPYMSHVFSTTNKVLRRTYRRDGATGVALLLAVQIPAAMLVGAAINVRNGKDPDKDLTLMTIKSMSALGSLNYPLEMMFTGVNNSGVTALAPAAKMFNFAVEGTTGGSDGKVSAKTMLENSPLNAALPIHYLVLALED